MNLTNLKNKRGFTLVELLIVIVILGIIAALVLPKLISQPEKAKIAQAGNSLGIIGRGLQAQYQMRGANALAWLDITVPANQKAVGLDGTPDTTEWAFTSGTEKVVRATRRNAGNRPAVCNGADWIELDTSSGTYTGNGCYAATREYSANVILKGEGT